jgi:hypothetical protein
MNIPFEKIADILQEESIFVESDKFTCCIHNATNHDTIFIEVDGVIEAFDKQNNKMVWTCGSRITLTNNNNKSFDFNVVARYNFNNCN